MITHHRVFHDNGDVVTYRNGLVHSWEDYEPAVITKDGFFIFFKDGKIHRERGPAFFNPVGKLCEYWLDGVQYSYEKWDLITNHSDHYP